MRYKLFEEIVLNKDIPGKNLKKGDIATIVEYHPVTGGEEGYSLEVFNALGDTIAVITVPESAIESLTEYEVFSPLPGGRLRKKVKKKGSGGMPLHSHRSHKIDIISAADLPIIYKAGKSTLYWCGTISPTELRWYFLSVHLEI